MTPGALHTSVEKHPAVSICCVTYNHERFIVEAVESFLSQKTKFDFEIVICEDCSVDRTRQILEDYEKRFPDRFRIFYNTQNTGATVNFMKALSSCRGKYIALCEGDDYWIDPFKLQKQYSFLENNSDCSFCYTNAVMIRNNDLSGNELFLTTPRSPKHPFSYILDSGRIAPNCSAMFRRSSMPEEFPEWFRSVFHGDFALQGLIGLRGNFGYINEVTAAYRIHPNSLMGSVKNAVAVSENFLSLLDNLSQMMHRADQSSINRHRADHLEFMAFEKLKQREWKSFFSLMSKSLRYDFFRDIRSWRRGFYRFRKSLKSAFSHKPSLN